MVSQPESEFVLPANAVMIAGPTAVGKSEIALCLAQQMGGEIISVDSMQVYCGLDIGTAKPCKQQRSAIPHHLIDIVTLAEAFDAAQFVRRAQHAATDIYARGRLPIFCGGTGLYFRALIAGLGSSPPGNASLRAELERLSLAELLHELAALDPLTHDRIDQKNRRRVVRAVEVIRLTGKAYSAQKADWEAPQLHQHSTFVCLTRETAELHLRIDARVESMFRAGLVEETEALLRGGLETNRTAMQAIGYRQVVEYLRGERSLLETIELVKSRTRQFAKRQMTWFRQQTEMEWIKLGDNLDDNVEILRRHVIAQEKNHLSYGPKGGIIS